jgi:hypothetical protein
MNLAPPVTFCGASAMRLPCAIPSIHGSRTRSAPWSPSSTISAAIADAILGAPIVSFETWRRSLLEVPVFITVVNPPDAC